MTDAAAHHDEWVRRPASAAGSNCTPEQYAALYRRSIDDSDGFWLEQAQRLDWAQAPTKAGDWSFATAVGLVKGVVGAILIFASNRIAKKMGEEGIF